jgi:uncharacterized protein YjbI with pentapeptide repeats
MNERLVMGSADHHHHRSQSSGTLLRRLDAQELRQNLEHHKQWVNSRRTGEQAGEPVDLSRVDLTEMSLPGADLRQINLQKSCLRGADLRGANLLEADLSGANLLNAKLQDSDLRDADLKDAEFLLGKQLAGSDLGGARLPDSGLEFGGLEIVEQISRNARTILFSTLLACVYTWLTVATTTDPLLLTNSISSPLPIIRTEIPIAGFFWVAPLILLGLYLYFHIYLQRLWENLAELPAVFPDGTRLDKKAYPWLLNGLVARQFKRLRNSRPQFSRLQTVLSVLLAWWTVPITLLVLWLRYLPRHDWLGTVLHAVLAIASIGGGILFYRTAMGTLRRDKNFGISSNGFRTGAGGVKRAAFVTVMLIFFFGFSYGAIHGIPHTTIHAANLNALDVRLWVPRLMEMLGNSTFVDFIEENLSTQPANWAEKSNLGLIKGARLKNADLAYARARSAFLVKADLRRANLFGADLRNADLRLADLQEANLRFAHLSGARLDGVRLKDASLQGVKLANYDFYSVNFKGINLKDADLNKIRLDGANLQEASFEKARLQKVDLGGTNLKNADFTDASLDDVNFSSADLQGALFLRARGFTREALWKAANWIFAIFDNQLLEAFGLPLDFPEKVENKNLSEMNLKAIYFRDSSLKNFDFQKSDLQEARFFYVDLDNANFSRANLRKAQLRNVSGLVDLSASDLQQAEVGYSKLAGANFREAILKRAKLTQVDLRNADLAHANLSGISFGNWVNIDRANLKGADLRNAHIGTARGLTCRQLQEAIIDGTTRLPDYLGGCGQ